MQKQSAALQSQQEETLAELEALKESQKEEKEQRALEQARKQQVATQQTDCIVSEWSNCSNGSMTRTITQPTNGGIACKSYETEITSFCGQ